MEIKYFIMSIRYNKNSPEDFGLIPSKDEDIYIMPSDNSLWRKRNLYDFGWGKETGFYRIPLPKFNELINIMLDSCLNENKYGAASIILDDYIEELLNISLEILSVNTNIDKYYDMFKILRLDEPINRSPIIGKNYNDILKDYEKWKYVSDQIKLREKR